MPITIPTWVPPVVPASELNTATSAESQSQTIPADSVVIPVCYGEAMLGGRVFAITYTGGYWYIGALFCWGEIDSYVQLYLNDAAPVAGVTVTYYTGTTAQTADATLAAAIAGYADTLVVTQNGGSVGVAYVVIKYSDSHYQSLPTIRARIKGRKVDPVQSNRHTYSEQFDHANWAKSGADVGVTANAAASPWGAVTADKLTEATTATTSRYITQTPAGLQADQQVACSVYAKRVERNLRLNWRDRAGAFHYATFDLAGGAVLNTSGTVTAKMSRQSAQDYWRCLIVVNVASGGTAEQLRIGLANDAGSNSYAGVVGSGAYVFGAQSVPDHDDWSEYYATTSAATAVAWSDDPVTCARDFLRNAVFGAGEMVDDISARAAYGFTSATLIAAARAKMALVIDQAKPADEWAKILGQYCQSHLFRSAGRWRWAPDRTLAWNFFDLNFSAHGWTGVNCSITAPSISGTPPYDPIGMILTTTVASGTVAIISPEFRAISGEQNYIVRARIRRQSASGGAVLRLQPYTEHHSASATVQYYPSSVASAGIGVWETYEWDMRDAAISAGGEAWVRSGSIYRLRLSLWASSAIGQVVEVAWVSVGIRQVNPEHVLRGSMRRTVADPAQAPTVVSIDYTDTSTTPWRTRRVSTPTPSSGEVRGSSVSLPGITRYAQAYREAYDRLGKLEAGRYAAEWIEFDRGAEYEQGDLVSAAHDYLGAPMADRDTVEVAPGYLYRITEPPEMVSPGRWRIRAVVPMAATDYDTTEPAAPSWTGAAWLIGSPAYPNTITGSATGSDANITKTGGTDGFNTWSAALASLTLTVGQTVGTQQITITATITYRTTSATDQPVQFGLYRGGSLVSGSERQVVAKGTTALAAQTVTLSWTADSSGTSDTWDVRCAKYYVHATEQINLTNLRIAGRCQRI